MEFFAAAGKVVPIQIKKVERSLVPIAEFRNRAYRIAKLMLVYRSSRRQAVSPSR